MDIENDVGVCDVCRLVKKDMTMKPVMYCSLCDSNLCDDCRGKYHLRAIAAIKQTFQEKE